MRTLKRFVAQEDGIALATVVFMIAILTVLAATLLDQVTNESNRAANATTSDAVYQAAEAGIGDYVAKLTEDPAYYDHVVANGEATRTSCTTYSSGNCTAWGSLTAQHGTSWTTGTHWGYNATATNHKDNWYRGTGNGFGNSTLLVGYAYDLMITPPSPTLGTNYVTILSTGCRLVSGGTTCDSTVPMRSIRVRVSRNTPADFQYMTPDMNGVNVCFGSNLYGKVYSVGDINVCGADAYGNLLADNNGSVASMCSGGSCGVTLHSPARIYDRTHPNIRDVIPNKITFAQLNVSLSNIQRAAALNSPTTVFDDSTAAAWRINFSADGNYQAWKCVRPSGTSDTAYAQPFCGGDLAIASGGAAKFAKTVNVTGNGSLGTSEFPPLGSIYIGSGSTWEKFTYSSKTATSFTCSGTCGLANAHAAGETVSIKSGGISWSVPWQTGPIPSNGALYTAQNAIVSWPSAINGGYNTGGCPSYVGTAASSVNGRVTLGSNGDIDVAGNICLLSQVSPNPNDDVLGLVAKNNIWITDYAPNDLWWRAATIALNGAWGDYDVTKRMTQDPYGNPSRLNHSMTFTGTASYASASGAMQSGDGTYGYNIDNVNRLADDGSMATIGVCPSTAPGCTSFNALGFLFPPWFPVLNGENIDLFQEVSNDDLPPVG